MQSAAFLRFITSRVNNTWRSCSGLAAKNYEAAVTVPEPRLPQESQGEENGINLPCMPGPGEELKPGAYLDKDGVICIVPTVGYTNPYEFLEVFTPMYKPNPPAPKARKTLGELIAEQEEENKPVWTEASRDEIKERFRRFETRTIDLVDPNVPMTVPIMSDEHALVVMTNNRPGEPLITNDLAALPIYLFASRSKRNTGFFFQKGIRRLENINTLTGIRYELKWRKYDQLVRNQKFVDARFYILGPDLSAAHFLIYRGATVKFKGKQAWYDDNNFHEVPTTYEKGWEIEEINASNVPLVYEGLQNIRALKHVKFLNLSNSKYIDDWCLDRISGEFRDSLVSINLTGCGKITARGIESLGKIKTLRHVELGNRDSSKEFHLTCLLLEDLRSNLFIEGVKVNDQLLLEDVLRGNPNDGPEVQVTVKEIGCVLSRAVEAGKSVDSQQRSSNVR